MSLLEAQFGEIRIAADAVDKLRSDPATLISAYGVPSLREVFVTRIFTAVDIHAESLRVSMYEASVEVTGPIGHLIALQAIRLVGLVGADRVRLCECDRFYVQVGKRRFCSERCQKRVYMRRFRTGETEKE